MATFKSIVGYVDVTHGRHSDGRPFAVVSLAPFKNELIGRLVAAGCPRNRIKVTNMCGNFIIGLE